MVSYFNWLSLNNFLAKTLRFALWSLICLALVHETYSGITYSYEVLIGNSRRERWEPSLLRYGRGLLWYQGREGLSELAFRAFLGGLLEAWLITDYWRERKLLASSSSLNREVLTATIPSPEEQQEGANTPSSSSDSPSVLVTPGGLDDKGF